MIQDYVNEIVKSFQEALSLSVEAVYFTKESMPLLLMKAKQHGISLSTESGYLSPETVNLVLAKANAVAGNLAQQLDSKGFTASS